MDTAKVPMPTARIPMPTFTTASSTTVKNDIYEELLRLRAENAVLRLELWRRG